MILDDCLIADALIEPYRLARLLDPRWPEKGRGDQNWYVAPAISDG